MAPLMAKSTNDTKSSRRFSFDQSLLTLARGCFATDTLFVFLFTAASGLVPQTTETDLAAASLAGAAKIDWIGTLPPASAHLVGMGSIDGNCASCVATAERDTTLLCMYWRL